MERVTVCAVCGETFVAHHYNTKYCCWYCARDGFKKINREWQRLHKDRRKEWRRKNKERCKARRDEWKRRNPEKVREYNIKCCRRRYRSGKMAEAIKRYRNSEKGIATKNRYLKILKVRRMLKRMERRGQGIVNA